MPYDGYLGPSFDTADYLRRILLDKSGGVDFPAAILLDTVQGEGGVNVARKEWLQSIQAIAKETGALFIIDDIQMGCGRTGEFFSFELAGLSPDIIVMSKSLSGYGPPLSMLSIKEEVDAWQPGEHTSAFRGNNLALVSATAAVNIYWRTRTFSQGGSAWENLCGAGLKPFHPAMEILLQFEGEAWRRQTSDIAETTARKAYDRGLIVERCGPADQVVKLLPALTIDSETLNQGLEIFEECLAETLKRTRELGCSRRE